VSVFAAEIKLFNKQGEIMTTVRLLRVVISAQLLPEHTLG
jgi:hypothetical protein